MSEPQAERSKRAVRPDPARIVVPRKHGQVLVEPGYGDLVEALKKPKENGKVLIGEMTFAELKQAARRDFLAAAEEHARAIGTWAGRPCHAEDRWVFTGHQVEFYHAGVWAKVIAVDELAKRATAAGVRTHAFDLLVDHDTVDHLGFDVPEQVVGGAAGGGWKRTMVEWAAATAVPADSVAVPSEKQFEEWDAELASHPLTQTDAMAVVLSALRAGLDAADYTIWMSQARARLEEAMGLSVHHVPTGLLCRGLAWQQFIGAWAQNVEPWQEAYNRHLQAYRKRQGIKNDHHPMPDLACETVNGVKTCELPFWIYRKGEARQRLLMRNKNRRILFLHDGVEYELDSEFRLQNSELMVRPRALTLTMYVRLFLADLFIHGIGGALYDQITDGLIEDLFHAAPPYACVSAAWLLPLGQPLESSDEVNDLRSLRHHLLHNPQLAMDPFTAVKTDVAERIAERRDLIKRIAESLAATRYDTGAIRQRREWFDRLHAVNAELHGRSPNILRKLDMQIAECQRAREQNKVLLWREYFFGLHTIESLGQLIAKVRGA